MNIIHSMIANTCLRCVNDNAFSVEYKNELLDILEKFHAVKISNIWKFTRIFRNFENKYKEFGGNMEMLDNGIKTIRDEQYLAAAKMIPGIKLVKKGE